MNICAYSAIKSAIAGDIFLIFKFMLAGWSGNTGPLKSKRRIEFVIFDGWTSRYTNAFSGKFTRGSPHWHQTDKVAIARTCKYRSAGLQRRMPLIKTYCDLHCIAGCIAPCHTLFSLCIKN